jgi:hypothetical protein
MTRGIRRLIATVGLLALAATTAARAELRTLTLYERTGRAHWVVLGEVADGDDRFAEVHVLEIFKGEYDKPTMRIIYRLGNFLRKSWEDRLDFAKGERVVLFLKRYESDKEDGELKDKLKAEDLFAPAFGSEAKFTTPTEGEGAYVEAIRDFARVTALSDPAAQETALLSYLGSANPHILQAGLEQVLEGRLAGDAQVPQLMKLIESARDGVRLMSLQVLGQVAADLKAAKKTLSDQDDVVANLKGKVMGDGTDIYRAEAVKVIAALSVEKERAFLERISKEDRAQLVRYEASRALQEPPGR